MGIKRRAAAVLSAFMVLSCSACSSGSRNDANIGADSQKAEIGSSIQQNDVFDTQGLETEENSEVNENVGNDMGLKDSGMRVRLTFDGGEAVVRLEDNDAARDFLSRLPLPQTFEDFNSIEKICRLPEEITIEGVESGIDPDVADVTLYAPWNTLVFYYEDYGYNDDLIPMGHVESGMELLAAMGDEFTVTMERMEDDGQAATDIPAETVELVMTAGDAVITAELSDSETTREFLDTLPRTLTMNRYGDREYYARVEEITENGEAIEDFENGDVTYYPAGPSFAIFFDKEDTSNQSGLIRMGRITSDLSVFDGLGDTVEMQLEIKDEWQ